MNALSFLFPTLIIATFYFLLIRPHHRREKAFKKFQDALAPGMTVITTSGILGRIEEIDGPYVHLFIAKGVTIQVLKTAIHNEAYSPRQDIK